MRIMQTTLRQFAIILKSMAFTFLHNRDINMKFSMLTLFGKLRFILCLLVIPFSLLLIGISKLGEFTNFLNDAVNILCIQFIRWEIETKHEKEWRTFSD